MKRPQFTLRMALLSVCLFAVAFACLRLGYLFSSSDRFDARWEWGISVTLCATFSGAACGLPFDRGIEGAAIGLVGILLVKLFLAQAGIFMGVW